MRDPMPGLPTEANPSPDVELQPLILAHYERVGPLLERSFGGDPIVFANFPGGFDARPVYHVTDVPLTTTKLLWLVHRMYALEYHGWAPAPSDPHRLRFARILLEHAADFERMRLAATTLRARLEALGLDAVLIADGKHGLALWIPLTPAPLDVEVRAFLHGVADAAVAADPALLTTEPNAADATRVHVHVATNAAGHFSALPYSLRGDEQLHVVTPLRWDELAAVDPQGFTAATFADRLAAVGDVFADEVARIGTQTLPLARNAATSSLTDSAPRGHVITAALAILADGKARDAGALVAEALAQQLVPPQTRKYVYSSLIEYIARQLGHGRRPQLVQDAERNFRINEPPDDWPDLVPIPATASDPAVDALAVRLESTARGDDPSAFELACADAFAHLGFRTRHLGGHAEPDVVIDAQLGVLAYRIVLECKSAKGIVSQPDAAEAAKFAPPFAADYAVLIGPDFSDELEVASELQTHRVTALTLADLGTLLAIGATQLEVRGVLVPGFASEAIGDLVWERRHGHAKRIATIAALVQREGWNAQVTAAEQNARDQAARLTVDAAMLLVDAALHAAGSTQACTRDDVVAAFSHLTDPLIARAVWLDEHRNSVAVLLPSPLTGA